MTNFEEKQKLLQKIDSGNYDDAFIIGNLFEWIKTNKVELLTHAIYSCHQNKRISLINHIALVLLTILENKDEIDAISDLFNFKNISIEEFRNKIKEFGVYPSDIDTASYEKLSEFANEIITRCCEIALKQVILSYHELEKEGYEGYHNKISHLLCQSKNRNIRIYCCSILDNYSQFENDSDPRVRKIVQIRKDFKEKWENEYTQDQKELISYLAYNIKINNIQMYDGLVGKEKEDEMLAKFSGKVFKNGETDWLDFDEDIFHNINIVDKKILSNELVKLAIQGKIVFEDNLQKEFNKVFANTSYKFTRKPNK